MSENIINPIAFELPKNQSSAIKVIGVGGGGSNAVNYMFSQDIYGVDFVICNTDAQALENSPIPVKIQLGAGLTEGMGAGANPEIGEKAAQESYKELKEILSSGTKMVFITAGMGGGTGTGAAPIIAKIAKEISLLTVGIVTIPFEFEGKQRINQALKGIEKLKEHVDSLIIINNNKLREVYGNLGYKSGFSKADEVLSTAARGIAEVITHHYKQNIDLNDAKTVLSNSGTAIMGSAVANGEQRAVKAIEAALDSPLLNDNKITGAKNVLMLIVSGTSEVTIDEIGEINDHVRNEAGNDVNIILGVGDDENLGDAIAVTIIATGFSSGQQHQISNMEPKKIVHTLEDNQELLFDFDENPKEHNSLNYIIEDDRDDDIPKNIIVHDLEEEIYSDETINNIEVLYEDVVIEEIDDFLIYSKSDEKVDLIDKSPSNEEDSFIIHMVEEKSTFEKKQTEISFDLPLSNKDELIETSEEIEKININEAFLIHFENDKEVVYNLSDFEERIPVNQPISSKKAIEAVDLELQFELFSKDEISENQVKNALDNGNCEDLSPLNSSISDFKKTVEQRKSSMKEYNHVFYNKINNIDEYENIPAYKRMNIELEDDNGYTQNSRTSVETDENGIKLRTNNSFLHDNVD